VIDVRAAVVGGKDRAVRGAHDAVGHREARGQGFALTIVGVDPQQPGEPDEVAGKTAQDAMRACRLSRDIGATVGVCLSATACGLRTTRSQRSGSRSIESETAPQLFQ